jgi:hypothetical protein
MAERRERRGYAHYYRRRISARGCLRYWHYDGMGAWHRDNEDVRVRYSNNKEDFWSS